MKIEAGKFYRTRDGRKAGPMIDSGGGTGWDGTLEERLRSWRPDGSHLMDEGDLDLVAPWDADGPVRTVTRKEIVPGSYGRVRVDFGAEGGSIMLGLFSQSGAVERSYQFNADELRAAASVLNELADALTTPTA